MVSEKNILPRGYGNHSIWRVTKSNQGRDVKINVRRNDKPILDTRGYVVWYPAVTNYTLDYAKAVDNIYSQVGVEGDYSTD